MKIEYAGLNPTHLGSKNRRLQRPMHARGIRRPSAGRVLLLTRHPLAQT